MSTAARAASRSSSATPMTPIGLAAGARRGPCCIRWPAARSSAAVDAGEHRPRSSNSRWLPTRRRCAADRRFGAAAGQRLNPLAPATAPAARVARARRSRGRSDARSAISSDAASRGRRGGRPPLSGTHIDDVEPPFGQRAGLVEGDAPHRRQALQPRAALDQHALARRRGQRRHDRDRRRDHQRAGQEMTSSTSER